MDCLVQNYGISFTISFEYIVVVYSYLSKEFNFCVETSLKFSSFKPKI